MRNTVPGPPCDVSRKTRRCQANALQSGSGLGLSLLGQEIPEGDTQWGFCAVAFTLQADNLPPAKVGMDFAAREEVMNSLLGAEIEQIRVAVGTGIGNAARDKTHGNGKKEVPRRDAGEYHAAGAQDSRHFSNVTSDVLMGAMIHGPNADGGIERSVAEGQPANVSANKADRRAVDVGTLAGLLEGMFGEVEAEHARCDTGQKSKIASIAAAQIRDSREGAAAQFGDHRDQSCKRTIRCVVVALDEFRIPALGAQMIKVGQFRWFFGLVWVHRFFHCGAGVLARSDHGQDAHATLFTFHNVETLAAQLGL